MNNWFGKLQSIGKALMLPIAVLPAAALLLRFGAPDVLNIPFITKAGGAVFDNLALIFAIGIAVGLAKDNNGASGLAGGIGYLILTAGLKAIDKDLNMSVLAGIISGIEAGYLYNRFHAIGEWIIGAGLVGTFVYGVLNRLLIPVGLHHILNSFIWFVFGEYTTPAGVVATGDLNRFFAGDPHAGMFMGGFYIMMMFGMPAVALAMYRAAKPENRPKIAGALASVAFTSFLTGITEPIEFMFMFLAPALYAVHAVLTGLALSVSYAFGVLHGFGFSAGFIDYILSWGLATKPILIIPLGLVFGVVYYVIFSWAIRHYDIPTIGRYDEETAEAGSMDLSTQTLQLAEKLGGAANLETVSSCITRLRLTVKDPERIDEAGLKALGAKGVIRKGQNVQVIVGTQAEFIANEMNDLVKKS